MKHYDLIVLGSGGGKQVATRCKAAGWNVALINDGPFGGTCPVRGCIPKKVLSGSAEVADLARRLGDKGIVTSQPVMDWSALIKFKRSFTDPVPPGVEKELREAGVDVYTGSPRFTGNLVLEVNGEQLQADKVHIAVGAAPAKLPFDGASHMIDSDEFLELDKLPKRVVFVGGGYISFEFAHVAARFGAKVTLLHSNDQPLQAFDPDIVATLIEATREAGVEVELNARVSRVEQTGQGYAVITESDARYEADLVVHGAGRPPAIGALNLEATGVEYDPKQGIRVDEYLRSTSNPAVSASGDCADAGPPLSPVAGRQGDLAADNLLNAAPQKVPSYLSTSSVIYTTPPVARVGYLEKEARDKGLRFDTRTTDLSGFFDAKRLNLKYAKSKVLVETGSERILGAHLIGNHAEDLVNIFSVAIEHGLTTAQLQAPVFSFPSSSDDLRYMF